MKEVFKEFNKRVSEIEKYMHFLEEVHLTDASIKYHKGDQIKEVTIDNDLQKILRGNFFILVYNLLEASIKQAIISIYGSLKTDKVSYSKVKINYQKIWIKEHIGNKLVPSLNESIHTLVDSILKSSLLEFDDDKINISGSVDAKKIKEIAKTYGFSLSSKSKVENNKMFIVKTQRNNLAHGDFSVGECGGGYTVKDLSEIKESVVEYLLCVLKDVDTFIVNKEYLTKDEVSECDLAC